MRFALAQVLLLARLTWKEGVRRRMLLLGLLLTLGFILLYGLGVYYSFREIAEIEVPRGMAEDLGPGGAETRGLFRQAAAFQMLTFGMFVTSFLGAMVVCFSAAGMVTGDAESGTLQTILTRPINRAQLILGRFLGYASIYLAYLILLAGSLVLLTWLFADYVPRAPWESLALLAFQGLVLLGVVCLLSVVLPPLAAGIAGFMLFGFAFIGGVVEQIGRFLGNSRAEGIGHSIAYVMPSDSFFRMGLEGLSPQTPDALTMLQELGPLSGVEPSAGKVLYGLAYLVVALVVTIALFDRRDL